VADSLPDMDNEAAD